MVGSDRSRDSLFEEIVTALGEMPDQLAQAFILSHYRGLSAEEISKQLGVGVQEIPRLLEEANLFFYRKLRSAPNDPDSYRAEAENER